VQPAELFYFPWLSPPGQVLHNPRAGSPATRARGHNRGEFMFGGNICGSHSDQVLATIGPFGVPPVEIVRAELVVGDAVAHKVLEAPHRSATLMITPYDILLS
jgi:hypothetical protein